MTAINNDARAMLTAGRSEASSSWRINTVDTPMRIEPKG
jgi:hypothetical protein